MFNNIGRNLQQFGSHSFSFVRQEFNFFKKYFTGLSAIRYFSRLLPRSQQPPQVTLEPPTASAELIRRLEAIADTRFNELPANDENIENDADPRSLLRSVETGPADATELDLTAGRESI